MIEELRNLPAPAKLNLFLHITGRRSDGYHLLETVFDMIDVGDRLLETHKYILRYAQMLETAAEYPMSGIDRDGAMRALSANWIRRHSLLPKYPPTPPMPITPIFSPIQLPRIPPQHLRSIVAHRGAEAYAVIGGSIELPRKFYP